MSIGTHVKSISYLKYRSVEILRDLTEGAGSLAITQDDEGHNVTYAGARELVALLKLLALARDDIAAGRVEPLQGLKHRIRSRAAG